MKAETHPVYPAAKITCACGNTFETRSTRGSFGVEVCAQCHPFFTGKYKVMDTQGRIDRFNKKYGEKKGATGKAGAAAAAAATPTKA